MARAAVALAAAAACLGAGFLVLAPQALALAGPPIVSGTAFSAVTETSAKLEASLNPNGKKVTDYHFEYIAEADWVADGEQFGEGTQTTPTGELPEGTEAVPLSATLTNLTPATAYRFRLFAKNSKSPPEGSPGEELAFATYPTSLAGLPDNRAYEQASPTNKNGGDAIGTVAFVKAAEDGSGITFASSSGIPGGLGAQELPLFLASRGEEGWLTQGLLPPASLGQKVLVVGWTPDFSQVFQQATIFGKPATGALFARSPDGTETAITPYVDAENARSSFAGASADGGEVVFESRSAQLPTDPAGVEGHSNVYVWERETGQLSLASQMNTEAETATALAKGAFAGPYDWALGETSKGGAARQYYTQAERAVGAGGSVFFTAAGSGHIYRRLNPTRPQSAMAAGQCSEAEKACTIDVSATERTPPDPAGARPRAFQAASKDGQTALFTSAEELTNDANTGPEVLPPLIGRATLQGEAQAEDVRPAFLAGHHAVGIARAGEHIYWADPTAGTIGRAGADGSNPEDDFIVPGETEAETHPETEPGVLHSAPSTPRYLALGPCAGGGECVYWTNTGPLGGDGNGVQLEVPVPGAGTIGRAKLDALGEPEQVEPEFIAGATNPQGIAVDAEHVYWANSLQTELKHEADIARAALDGGAVEQHFHELANTTAPYGVTVSATHVYWTEEGNEGGGFVSRIPLEGGSEEFIAIEHGKLRGIAVDATHAYWAAQGAGAIGRLPLADFQPGPGTECAERPGCETEFLKPGGSLIGLATDAGAEHLFWSANGETPPHPGNDLYRFDAAAGGLTDLTPDSADLDGAGVQGVLGASEDGSRAYFLANGDLDGSGPATNGDCHRMGFDLSGSCSLYLWEENGTPAGSTAFVARLDAGSDSSDWQPTIATGALKGGQKSSFLSADGRTLLFSSQRKLTAYENKGTPELYLYRVGEPLACVSCNPTEAPPLGAPSLGTIGPSALRVALTTAVASRNLADGGRRVFFESVDPLVLADTDGAEGCPPVGSPLQGFPACRDAYEWEAPGTGSCTEGGPSYSPANAGCLYLISSGKSKWASLLADASASGSDVFFFTRESLVGQDKDGLLDVYDARVGGGLAAQNPPPPQDCGSAEACRPGTSASPQGSSPATPNFTGPGNLHEKPRPRCRAGSRATRRHGKSRCVRSHRHRKAKHGRGGRR